jgi:predicted porin
MKRNLIATAALLSMAGAAQAQLTIYGLVDLSYGKSLYADIFLNEDANFHSGGDNGNSEGNSTTRVGLKGSIDVGSGIKANFRFESNGITSDGEINDPVLGRQAWGGFSGGFGEVRLGRQDSVPYQIMGDFDFNGQSNGVSALGYSGVAPWLPGRQSRSLQYIAPEFVKGLSAQVGFLTDANRGDDAKNVFSAGAKFATGGLLVGGSIQTKDSDNTEDFYSVAASYDFSFVKLMASYADGGKVSNGGSGKGFGLGFVAPVAGFNVGGHYGDNDDSALKIKSYELFINKEILKNTYAYLEYGNWEGKGTNFDGGEGRRSSLKGSGYAIGVIFTF